MEGIDLVPWTIVGTGMTVLLIGLPFAIVFWVMAAVRRGEAAQRELMVSGEPAEATVIDTNYTGVRVNGRMQVGTKLDIRRPGHEPYRATMRYFLDGKLFSNTPLYPPGAIVQVRIDPRNPKRVVVVGMAGSFAPSSGFGAASPGQTSATQLYMINGQRYNSLAEMPPEARQAMDHMQQVLGDENKNGVPDLLESLGATAGTAMHLDPQRSPSDRLAELKRMHEQGLISTQEYDVKKAEILRAV